MTKKIIYSLFVLFIALSCSCFGAEKSKNSSYKAIKKHRTNNYESRKNVKIQNNSHTKPTANSTPSYIPTKSSLIADVSSGKILFSENANQEVYPASLTKVMTVYLIFEALEAGKISLDQKWKVSKYATQAMPCKLFLKPNDHITVREAILALVVKSANDAARVAAENMAGSESSFARIMTHRARQLGMHNTNFTNASGWHCPKQKTTVVDLAKLSIAIKRDFPQYYHFFAQTEFSFKGKAIKGHNYVTANYPGAEGLKTGYTSFAGRNLITIATRHGKSLVGVITGSSSNGERDKKMMNLLDKHFAKHGKASGTLALYSKHRNVDYKLSDTTRRKNNASRTIVK